MTGELRGNRNDRYLRIVNEVIFLSVKWGDKLDPSLFIFFSSRFSGYKNPYY